MNPPCPRAGENETDVSQLTSTQRKRVYVAFYQFHLPRIDDFGVIDFVKHRDTVELRDTTPLEPYLSVLDDGSESSVRLARALAAVVSVVGSGSTGVGVLAVVPGVLWAAVAVGVLLLIVFTTA